MNVDGITQIRVTSVAKTVADCFKYRNKIGLDVALEALREARSSKRATMDELWQCAQWCRVSNVMRPYLETLV
jgi:predicted transcriptional regulator of viral defense system